MVMWIYLTVYVCVDVDECSLENVSLCGDNTVCSNEVGGFSCSPGSSGSESTSGNDENVNSQCAVYVYTRS